MDSSVNPLQMLSPHPRCFNATTFPLHRAHCGVQAPAPQGPTREESGDLCGPGLKPNSPWIPLRKAACASARGLSLRSILSCTFKIKNSAWNRRKKGFEKPSAHNYDLLLPGCHFISMKMHPPSFRQLPPSVEANSSVHCCGVFSVDLVVLPFNNKERIRQ